MFRDQCFVDLIKNVFVCYPLIGQHGAHAILVTGIPPHVVILSEMQSLSKKVDSILPAMWQDFSLMPDDRTMNGVLSETLMKQLTDAALSSGKMNELFDRVNEIAGRSNANRNDTDANGAERAVARQPRWSLSTQRRPIPSCS